MNNEQPYIESIPSVHHLIAVAFRYKPSWFVLFSMVLFICLYIKKAYLTLVKEWNNSCEIIYMETKIPYYRQVIMPKQTTSRKPNLYNSHRTSFLRPSINEFRKNDHCRNNEGIIKGENKPESLLITCNYQSGFKISYSLSPEY